MPLTEFQREVLAVIVGNRSEQSHFAGGLVLNAAADSARFSKDFDLFHDEIRDLDFNSRRDSDALEAAGFLVERGNLNGEWEKLVSFRTAIIRRGDGQVAVDWAHDSAFRFFPIMEDPLLGWRLHLFDMAVNKALALSARTVTRDYIDILELSHIYPLEAIIWAACGKDEGFSPMSLLGMMRRFAKTEPGNLDKLMVRQLDPIEMKKQWLAISDLAEAQILHVADTLIDLPVGVAFVDEQGQPDWIGRNADLKVHHGSLRGCWPVVRSLIEEGGVIDSRSGSDTV